MPHPDHDAIIAAFIRCGAHTTRCVRGGDQGYTHVHGPNCAPTVPDNQHCTNHVVVVERRNGTVGVWKPLATQLGAKQRPPVHIRHDPLGYSVRKKYGQFGFGWTAQTILAWPGGVSGFAAAVVNAATGTRW
ncbi:MAG: hypothetical protein IT373_03850 [Polyangiaceae bacterium]|nr:hypothetical protein [Polyangiaceae bacterium]